MIDPGLRGKVALVTGANHGIGAATAKALAAQGAAVFLTYLRLPYSSAGDNVDTPGEAWYRQRQAQAADQVVEVIRARGGRAAAWEADLTAPTTIPPLFDRVEAAFGPVDILVNNAAHGAPDSFLVPHEGGGEHSAAGFGVTALTPESHARHFAVNSRAAALLMAEYAGAMWHGARGGAGSLI